MKFLSLMITTVLFSLAANAESDVYKCAGAAVKAALIDAKFYTNGEKVTYGSTYNVRPSQSQELTVYEVAILRWHEEDSFGLTYEVVVRGQKPNCQAVRVEIIGEE